MLSSQPPHHISYPTVACHDQAILSIISSLLLFLLFLALIDPKSAECRVAVGLTLVPAVRDNRQRLDRNIDLELDESGSDDNAIDLCREKGDGTMGDCEIQK